MKRNLGALAAAGAVACLFAAGTAFGGSWDERVFTPGSHVDFDSVAAAGSSALPALIERGRELFKAKFTTADGAGRPKATQAIIPTKRKSGVNPPFTRTSGPDSNSCFGCHNDPVEGGSGDDVANVFVSEGFESAQFDNIDPSFSSERHTIALMGAGLVELLAREMTADLQAIRADAVKQRVRVGQGGARRPRQQGRAVRLDRRPPGRDRRPRLGRRRRRRPHRAAVQPQGRVHFAAPVHHQRAQRPSRHGGVRALRRALDRQRTTSPRAACPTRSPPATSRRWSPSRRRCRRRPSRPTCPTTGAPRRRKARGSSTRSAARPVT